MLTPPRLEDSTLEDVKAWDDPESGRVEHLDRRTALVSKEPLMRDFKETVLSKFSFKGRLLEIGGGMCWASYLVKKQFPECMVYASDVAYSALVRAQQLSKLLTAKPDVYLTLDVQSCPFPDNFFDFVFGSAILHHLPDLVTGLTEIRRMLKPNGRLIVIQEHALSPLFQVLVKRLNVKGPGKETQKYGIQESMLSLTQFKTAFKRAGFSNVQCYPCKKLEYKPSYPKSVTAYYLALTALPDFVPMYVLGSEIHIIAKK